MNFKKILKVISAIVALAGVAVAIYFAIQKLMGTKKPEYFDDNDFFECDNEIEIVEASDVKVNKEAPAEEKKPAPKKKAPAKKTTKTTKTTKKKAEAKDETEAKADAEAK